MIISACLEHKQFVRRAKETTHTHTHTHTHKIELFYARVARFWRPHAPHQSGFLSAAEHPVRLGYVLVLLQVLHHRLVVMVVARSDARLFLFRLRLRRVFRLVTRFFSFQGWHRRTDLRETKDTLASTFEFFLGIAEIRFSSLLLALTTFELVFFIPVFGT